MTYYGSQPVLVRFVLLNLVLRITVYPFLLLPLPIALSVLRLTAPDYPCGIFNPCMKQNTTIYRYSRLLTYSSRKLYRKEVLIRYKKKKTRINTQHQHDLWLEITDVRMILGPIDINKCTFSAPISILALLFRELDDMNIRYNCFKTNIRNIFQRNILVFLQQA